MGVVIESSVWEPNPSIYIFLFVCCCFSIFLFPYASNHHRTSTIFDHGISSSFLRFQRNFLFVYSLASVMEGLWSVFGEYELASYGLSRKQMIESLYYGYTTALFAAPFLGVLSDLIGHKKVSLIFCILHLFAGIWKRFSEQPSIFMTSIYLSLASTIFLFSFETWMVTQHEKQGHRQDSLNDTFWLMTFFESAWLIASQMFANWLIGNSTDKNIAPSSTIIILATICFTFVTRGWTETPGAGTFKDYSRSFYAYIFGDKRIWLLTWAQMCLHFSIGIFWILWAPTVVADGREVQLGLIYPSFLASRMIGSTIFPCLTSGPSSLRTEDCLVYAYVVLALLLSFVAYDYQVQYFREPLR
ncbi:hypothetical protein Ahy_Scaffold1g106974 isoform B [Arachis hypogaea]|uniref:Molybdate-anion transporter n=1 Tax=Arachis hypogaea TaxID=3818 RepID=A0A444WTY7_ARAHY|nr:hypothetical protein Ahy_Scaffold1g106974 isoform B [Arachis hypogaea]